MAYQLELFPVKKELFKISADELKVAIMQKYIYDKHYDLAATEVHYCDIIIANINACPIIEIETKISWNDFLADFDKPKHQNYVKLQGLVPDYFFFGVPDYMEKDCLDFLNESKYNYYGLISVNSSGFVSTIKKSKHFSISKNTRNTFFQYLLKRGTRQLINFYEEKNINSFRSNIDYCF